MVRITIDGTEIETSEGVTILQAADAAEIYIPRLCSHPDIPPIEPDKIEAWPEVFRGPESIKAGESANEATYEGCQLCLVQIDGQPEPVRSCVTEVSDGLNITTSTDEIINIRKEKLKKLFATHPHACIQCAQRQGCALEPCSTDVAKEERCCPIFHTCELRDVAEFVGIPPETTRYLPANLPKIENEPLFLRDYNLCINCLRCVRICRDVRGVDALGFILNDDGDPIVGSKAPTLKDSGCVFCLSCVEVCPTGTLRLKFEDPRVEGTRLACCTDGCPAGMDIPRYVREVRRGEYGRAEAVVRESAPLPRILGQVCFHPCEESCLRSELSEPVAICSLKRVAVEHSQGADWKSHLNIPPSTGKKIAIIGAGPSGLTAAWFLKLKGHEIILYDSQPSPGGWLRNGIPPFRLSSDALDADVQDIVDLGIELKMGVEVGKDIGFDDIKNSHDAIYIAIGARAGRHLPCDGADLPGVENGLDLLDNLANSNGTSEKSLEGETVVIIGGGNVAIDIARTAVRLNPDEIHLYCLEERDEMPAYRWEIDAAEAEGIVMHPGWGPKLIDGDGKVERIDFRKCTSVFDEKGQFSPKFDESVTTSQDATRILIAIGQAPVPIDGLDNIRLKPSGNIETESSEMQTSIDGVFAGGEVVSGPASVIESIEQGKRAASGIDKYLGGDGDIQVSLLDDTALDSEIPKIENFFEMPRTAMSHLPAEEAAKCFDIVEKGFTTDQATLEASRCLQCDLRLLIQTAPKPPESWLEMTEESVNSVPEIEGVYQLLDEEKVVYAIKGVDNLREALQEILENTEKAKFFLYDEDPFFSKRESELLQEYLKIHGKMPPGEGDDDLDDLF